MDTAIAVLVALISLVLFLVIASPPFTPPSLED